jgi:4-hydroxybenzoyl-CoA reductase subunit beta
MLPLPNFQLERPRTVEEACSLLAEGGRPLAGGTDLLPNLKNGLAEPTLLVALWDVEELHQPLGAMTRLRDLGDTVDALKACTRSVATPTIQRMATLGGNLLLDSRCRWFNQSRFWREALPKGPCLKCDGGTHCYVAPKGTGCYAAHSADTVPVLWLLEAEVELASTRGRRLLPVDRLDERATDELLVRVRLPSELPAVVFRKLRARAAIDYPQLLTAVREDGAAVFSAIGPKPIRVDLPLDPDGAGDAAYAACFPLDTHNASSTWRKHMVRVEARRAVQSLVG